MDGNLDIDIIGRSTLPEGIDSIAGALGFDGGAPVGRLAVEQRGGRLARLLEREVAGAARPGRHRLDDCAEAGVPRLAAGRRLRRVHRHGSRKR